MKKGMKLILALVLAASLVGQSSVFATEGDATEGTQPTETTGSETNETPESESGVTTFAEPRTTYVAEVDSKQYETIQAAIDATTTGEIKLLLNTSEDITVASGKTITLDLNGMTLTNVSTDTITNKGTLTVKGSGTVDNITHAKAAISNEGGTVTLNGGTFTRSQENGFIEDEKPAPSNSWYVLFNHGTMTINSGTNVTTASKYSSMIENGWYVRSEGTSDKAILTINGGTFNGGLYTVKNDDWGKCVINDGTFDNAASGTVLNWNILTISGGNFNSGRTSINNWAYDTASASGKVSITGGTFEHRLDCNKSNGVSSSYEITGGSFKEAPADSYVVAGYAATTSAGYYTVDKAVDVEVEVSAKPSEVANEASASEDVVNEVKTITANVSSAALAVASDSSVIPTTEAATSALTSASVDTSDKTVTVVVEPYLDIQIKTLDTTSDIKKLTLDITPKYNLVATTASTPNDIVTEESGKNAVVLKTAQPMEVTKAVTITIPVAKALNTSTLTNDEKESIFVQHTKEDGKVYIYDATLDATGNLTFVNPNGFSEFAALVDTRKATIKYENNDTTSTVKFSSVGTSLPTAAVQSGYSFDGWLYNGAVYTTMTPELFAAISAETGNVEFKIASHRNVVSTPVESENDSTSGKTTYVVPNTADKGE